ncbi:OPT superfamily oligopeptide transporter [Coniochaeta ligniaria NRRL 30616]|uniref:OPT superfamily oligopeptide transporter n=1 Tax=Coniochaeta ligniaria NRRL 30616 TaxID=1408157 RepID=A0A1J7J7X5_9PEZI|nr:OPT superfamily oligopeptide transporter [Coniochaeta ligniaria NRRL 30616]
MAPIREEPVRIEGHSFTARGVAVGLAIGLVLACTNISMGLQSGWVSTMTMPASLMGFGFFKMISKHLKFPFSPVENVLVQTVAGSMGIMPLGCGLVGVIPAMNFLLMKDEKGPLNLSLWQLVIWSLGVCYFGVVFAVPLRRQVIIREQLKFPSGFSTAVLISMLHGRETNVKPSGRRGSIPAGFASLASTNDPSSRVVEAFDDSDSNSRGPEEGINQSSWKRNVQLMLLCFSISGFFTLLTYFFPLLRRIPIFGMTAASTWLWDFNPSLAYVGQGVIMGPTTTLHMLLGAVVGWGILSPLAKYRGWAPGDIGDWENGSKGWIVWISLAIMLADAIVSLGYLALRPVFARLLQAKGLSIGRDTLEDLKALLSRRPSGYTTVSSAEDDGSNGTIPPKQVGDGDDAPADQQISNRIVGVGLVLSILICIFCTHVVFGNLVPLYATIVAVMMALLLSIMGVRALGETDLNPVSGISKLAQLFFAVIIPQSNKSSVLINLVAGAISEAGALQAGDLMQDLKTGHLLGAAPKAQFWGQVIGATAGAVVSAFIYRLYTAVYTIPSELYQVPTAYVWIFTARLVTGKGLPYMAREWALGSAILFAAFTALRIKLNPRSKWQALIPGGIAVAVGMYNVPSFTLARAVGGVLSWWWRSRMGWEETPLIVLASGFILGEGFLNIVNLLMESAGVPHL